MPNPLSIAIVGMAGIFPGAADLSQFWHNIIHRQGAAEDVPAERWVASPERMVHNHFAPDVAISRKACLIHGFSFAPEGFEIAPEWLTDLDPLYQMVLHTGKSAINDPEALHFNREKTGVVLAAIGLPTDSASAISRNLFKSVFEHYLQGSSDYRLPTQRECWSSRVTAFPAALLAKSLGLGGGSFTLDAACASSLFAIKLACDQLQSLRCDTMLAGGVSRPDCLYTQVGFSQLRALSPTGRCAPFDQSANGLVVGEGAGIVVLKRLEDAVADGNTIYGVIRGLGLSNDLRGNLLAPDAEGQVRAMRSAYASSGWSPDDVDLIECHGAGTPLGDATELRSMRTLWQNCRWKPGQCAIGSVKSMIGHLLTAAGVAGVVKTLLAIEHKTLPPSLNFSQAAADSPLKNGPFRVQTEAQPWQPNQKQRPRRAAISAFGFGGINAHLLVEEWPSASAAPAAVLDTIRESSTPAVTPGAEPIAVVGMAGVIGTASDLSSLQDAILNGRRIIDRKPPDRWKGFDHVVAPFLKETLLEGGYLTQLIMDTAAFRIPPIEYADILPQHLLMVKTAAEALMDAGLPQRQERPLTAAIIGADFDYEATNFDIRWWLYPWVTEWLRSETTENALLDINALRSALQDAASPPLTATRTLGALVSMVASRIAREFRLGGPCFTVSCAANSGIRALDIAVRMIRQGEIDSALIGAVDLCGDLRYIVTRPSSATADVIDLPPKTIHPAAPGEGAVALVLTPLKKALTDNRRIYAVIRGVAHGGGGGIDEGVSPPEVFDRALRSACDEADTESDAIGHLEVAGGNIFDWHSNSLDDVLRRLEQPRSLGALTPISGYTGAVSGLAGVLKVALSLYHNMIPAAAEFPDTALGSNPSFFLPPASQPWPNTESRTAAVVSATDDGNVSAVVLTALPHQPQQVSSSGVSDDPTNRPMDPSRTAPIKVSVGKRIVVRPIAGLTVCGHLPRFNKPLTSAHDCHRMLSALQEQVSATAKAHRTFLEFSSDLAKAYADTFALQAQRLHSVSIGPVQEGPQPEAVRKPLFDRNQCLEFARGKVANVLGPDFQVADTYPIRVRLPDEPLMLVDRILSIAGEKKSLSTGKIVTEHDVRPGSWYLDGKRAPVCIAVEAGQADLFLCAFLGIDLAVKGQRAYRLLDASVVFHRHLPRPGETVRYEIEIEKFLRQGDTYLFFFHFEGFIGHQHLISMTDGCAGFFTEKEIQESGGILTTDKNQPRMHRVSNKLPALVPVTEAFYDDDAIDALRRGDLGACFGAEFEGVYLPEALRLPGGRMKLIDRVLSLKPHGGLYQLGSITAEADIHPHDWFLTCHFVDDMTMPGTLMYECCAHALRVFLLRLGWITDGADVGYEPVEGIKSILKCRGPVTPKTRRVVYRVELKEIGYRPQPYVIADAHMMVDGKYVVRFTDMSLQMDGTTRDELETYWDRRRKQRRHPLVSNNREAVFDRSQVLAFAEGRPSDAFGEPYRPFDTDRFIARLPRPPYSFIDRVVSAEPPPWQLPAEGWIEAQTDLLPEHWYFRADRSGALPYCVLLEIALQACGWLAAYAGSALKSDKDLKFRNLEGQAILLQEVTPQAMCLTVKSRMTKAAMAGNTLIEAFEFRVLQNARSIFEGCTTFGFFTPDALAQQRGLSSADRPSDHPASVQIDASEIHKFTDDAPLTPDDIRTDSSPSLAMPAKALRMIDYIQQYDANGGPAGLGYIRAAKTVDPEEWFFKAHFFQDPVCPGSLGIESFIQLIKFMALQRWPELTDSHRFVHLAGQEHSWVYRGQIVPDNKLVLVEAVVTQITAGLSPVISADGWLQVDGLYIYAMKNYGLKLIAKPHA